MSNSHTIFALAASAFAAAWMGHACPAAAVALGDGVYAPREGIVVERRYRGEDEVTEGDRSGSSSRSGHQDGSSGRSEDRSGSGGDTRTSRTGSSGHSGSGSSSGSGGSHGSSVRSTGRDDTSDRF